MNVVDNIYSIKIEIQYKSGQDGAKICYCKLFWILTCQIKPFFNVAGNSRSSIKLSRLRVLVK